MPRIFLSHSSANNAAAIALRDWIIAGGWDEHPFLDLDPERGIAAGERWERALHEAADRCEVVLVLVSREWLRAEWCVKEFNLAQRLNKRLFGVLIDDLPLSDLPASLTATWQIVNLASGNDHDLHRVNLPDLSKEEHVTFSRSGLARLKAGLDKEGLDPRFFAWPPENEPDRAPYPGLRPLEVDDAGIFFGREASTVVALDRLRGLREAAPPRLLVILGASGAGKSSFLRAGLTPRLTRDDANFLPLPIIRPETAAITGKTGLIQTIQEAFNARGQSLNRADITTAINGGASKLLPLLNRLVDKARAVDISGATQPVPPALVLSIDQGEELFLAEGAKEAQLFLALLKDLALAGAPNLIALFTIRSDSYERLQTAKALEGVQQETFALPLMPRGAYQIIIEGPAQRLKDSKRPLKIEPALTQALLTDIEEGGGKDALPLLAFTLERLYREYGADGDLLLKEYDGLGRIRGSIQAAVEAALQAADSDPTIPKDPAERLALLRRALIPALARIDPETRAPRRRVARISEIPREARGLIDCLVRTRLLATDDEGGETIIEPAHEALLRQWDALQGWLKEDSAALLALEGVRQAARDWAANGKFADWLGHSAGRLEDAERLRQREDFGRFIGPVEQAYLEACRVQENERRNRELEEAKKLAEAQTKIAHRTRIGLIAAIILAVLALGAAWFGIDKAKEAEKSRDAAKGAGEIQTRFAETLKALIGFVPEVAEQPLKRSEQALALGAAADSDTAQLEQIEALEEMARYFFDAWDTARTQDYLREINGRLTQIHGTGAQGPKLAKLFAGVSEIAADTDAEDDRNFEKAVREYNEAIGYMGKAGVADREFQLLGARLKRKLAAVKSAQGDYAVATSLIGEAHLALGDNDDALGERASLSDLIGRELAREGKVDDSMKHFREAVDFTRKALVIAREAHQPIDRLTVSLVAHLQHLGDALRQGGQEEAAPVYEEAEVLALEVLSNYPAQEKTRYMLDLIRHGIDLAMREGLGKGDRAKRLLAKGAAADTAFGFGFGRFKFLMSPAEVNALLVPPFGLGPWGELPRANEYRTGEVRYFWRPLAEMPDFQLLFDEKRECLDPRQDYVTFLFHEERLFRISFRLWGANKRGCRDRQTLFPDLARRYSMPLSGRPEQWRIHWETARSSLRGKTPSLGPMLDILVR